MENGFTFFFSMGDVKVSENSWQRALVQIKESLDQQIGLEVPLGSGNQEVGRRLLTRVFHRPIK